MEDATGYVGVELSVTLRASDPDGDALSYRVEAVGPAELGARGQVRPYNDGSTAVFRWTPLATDIGEWTITFFASDGAMEMSETIHVEVLGSTGANRPPSFHRPLGTGTTLELAKKDCVELTLEIEDPDDVDLVLSQKEPALDGASLEQTSQTTGAFRWCPSLAQIAQNERYTVTFVADDGKNPPQEKPFTIVLRKTQRPDCPGAAPVITHTPADHASVNPIQIAATITDDVSVEAGPLLYFWTSDPGATPVFDEQVEMTTLGSDSFVASPPNPIANMPPGSSARIWYVIMAQDKVDEATGCNHLVRMPATGSYSMMVTNPGTEGGLAVCETCVSDAQCGGDKDHCVTVGAGNACAKGCADDSECPATHQCSASPVTSVNGVMARQCMPRNGSCAATPPPPMCTDDSWEENDTLEAAATKPALVIGQTVSSLKTCPGATEGTEDFDWYKLVVTQGEVTINLNGTSATDLELGLYGANGLVIAQSLTATSNEQVVRCLQAGTYYVRVDTWKSSTTTNFGENTYSLSTSAISKLCADVRENDDNTSQATLVTLTNGKWTDTGRTITANDDDYHRVSLTAGQTLRARIAFTHSLTGDLDLHLIRVQSGSPVDLTPCTELNPGLCEPMYGQSISAPEVLTYPITSSGDYYVVVHGWDGSQNSYDICITTNNTCP